MEEVREMEEVRFNLKDFDRVSIPISEYRELIEAKCKAEAEADRNLNDWAREKRRADWADSELEELKAKFEEERLKNKADRAKASEQIDQFVDFINTNDLGDKFSEFRKREQNGRD